MIKRLFNYFLNYGILMLHFFLKKYLLIKYKNLYMFSGCDSVGDVFNPLDSPEKRIYGDIGIIEANENGRAAFRLEDHIVKLSDIIGRSFVITDQTQKEPERIACGIIARSAGLFQNPKKICACDGVTLWDEVSKPKSTL